MAFDVKNIADWIANFFILPHPFLSPLKQSYLY